MKKNAVKLAGALLSATVVVSAAGTGAASAHAASAQRMSIAREVAAVAESAGVSEADIYRMAFSVADNPPQDPYRFPEEAFQGRAGWPAAVVAFVRAAWRAIVDAAVRAGRWAWYKAGQCATGAVQEVWNRFGTDLTDAELVLAAAIYGCLKGLR